MQESVPYASCVCPCLLPLQILPDWLPTVNYTHNFFLHYRLKEGGDAELAQQFHDKVRYMHAHARQFHDKVRNMHAHALASAG